jgi:hypothetical protein
MKNALDPLLRQNPSVQITEAVEISIVSETARAAENASPHPPNTDHIAPATTIDHGVETETETETESGRRIVIVIAIASTDTATPATIPKKPQSENDPRHPTERRNLSRLPLKKSTPHADLRSPPISQTASRSGAPVVGERILLTICPFQYPPDRVKTESQLRYQESIARRKEKKKRIDSASLGITTLLAKHATNLRALAPTTEKKTHRNPPSQQHPLLQHQRPKTKTRTNLSAKPETASVCSKKQRIAGLVGMGGGRKRSRDDGDEVRKGRKKGRRGGAVLEGDGGEESRIARLEAEREGLRWG